MSSAFASDGTKLNYDVHGAGPLHFTLTHSLAMDRSFWHPVIAELGDAATVLTWDCRGHGASDKPAGPYTVERFADDLASVLDAAGIEGTVAAGASMGGTVTLALALRHPGRVRALGLIDTTASYGPGASSDWEARATKALSEGLASLTGFQQTRWFSDHFREAHPEIVAKCVEIFCANDLGSYAETCRMLGAANLTPGLARIEVPAAILVGEEDYATPVAMGIALQRAIANSTIEIIAGARHLTPLECPQLIASRLLVLAQGTCS